MTAIHPLLLPTLLWLISVIIGWRELSLYRAHQSGTWNEGTDLFVYTKGRFKRRLFGVAVLAATGTTLAFWELDPPESFAALSLYVGLFACEFLCLLVAAIIDLKETTKTANPANLRRQGDPGRQKRSR